MRAITLLAACLAPVLAAAQASSEPPNAPVTVVASGTQLTLSYQGRVLFEGRVMSSGGSASFLQLTDSADGRVTQLLKWTAAGGGRISILGVVRGSPEAFAAAVEPREDGLPVVRHAVGPVANRLNRAFYDRRADWVLSVDEPARAELLPMTGEDSGVSYQVSAAGGEVALPVSAALLPAAPRPRRVPAVGVSALEALGDGVVVVVRLLRPGDRKGHPPNGGRLVASLGPLRLRHSPDRRRLPGSAEARGEVWLKPNDQFPGGLDSPGATSPRRAWFPACGRP